MKDLSLHILDIVQNSIRADATRIVTKMSASDDGFLVVSVEDNGRGMDSGQVARVKDPFFTTRTTRKIGMGVALLTQKAEQSDGWLTVRSQPGEGTVIEAGFRKEHPDCPPAGDIPGTAWMLMASNPDRMIVFRFARAQYQWEWNSGEIRDALGGLPLLGNEVRSGLLDWFNKDFSNFKENTSHDQG